MPEITLLNFFLSTYPDGTIHAIEWEYEDGTGFCQWDLRFGEEA